MESLPESVLMDVREDHEWLSEHAAGAVHLGKGILERDIETRFPDRQTPIIMYCGGGYRSVLTAEIAQRMGYEKVCSLEGAFVPWSRAIGLWKLPISFHEMGLATHSGSPYLG